MSLGARGADADTSRYFDGQQPVPRPAQVRVDAAHLTVEDAERGTILARWTLREVALLAEPARGVPALFGRDDPADSRRVVIEDEAAIGLILGHAPHLAAARRVPQSMARILLGGLAATALVAFAFLMAWPPLADRVAEAVPVEWEAPLGGGAAAGFARRMDVCSSARGQAALDRLARRLVGDATMPFPLTVRVVRQPVVNALAFPGGHIFVFSELIRRAESANEVAGVLAHEIGHVRARHAVRQVVRSSAIDLASKALVGSSSLGDGASWFTSQAFSREFEAEADNRAIAMLKAAGIGAEGMGRFFARLEKSEGHETPFGRYLSSHPPTAERRALAEAAPSGGPAMSDAEWRALRAICDR